MKFRVRLSLSDITKVNTPKQAEKLLEDDDPDLVFVKYAPRKMQHGSRPMLLVTDLGDIPVENYDEHNDTADVVYDDFFGNTPEAPSLSWFGPLAKHMVYVIGNMDYGVEQGLGVAERLMLPGCRAMAWVRCEHINGKSVSTHRVLITAFGEDCLSEAVTLHLALLTGEAYKECVRN